MILERQTSLRATSGHAPKVPVRVPRIVVASGMQGTGVSTIVDGLRTCIPMFDIADAGSVWADIFAACTDATTGSATFTRMIAVTINDIIAISSTYALVKLVREHFPSAPIEIVVNRSSERDALKTYERIQGAASHFLREMVSYAGAVPEEHPMTAIQHIAHRLEDELAETPANRLKWGGEPRKPQ